MRLRNFGRRALLSGPLWPWLEERRSRRVPRVGHAVPPVLKAVRDKVACLGGTAERNMQLSAVFVQNTERIVLFRASDVMVGRRLSPLVFPLRLHSPIFTVALQSMLLYA